jgi:hypothetical protein
MPGKYLRGALISFSEVFPLPVPNLILFQYNPEKLTHAWTPSTIPGVSESGAGEGNPLAISGEPGESFSFSLFMDANDSIADDGPIGEALGTVSGVATRIAALEMLLFPTAPPGGGLLGSLSASLSIGGGGASVGGSASAAATRPVPAAQLPTVLFVWGPGRVLPVRVSALSFTETLYHPLLLVPTHAEATITLTVLTTAQVAAVGGPLGALAKGAYTYTSTVRQALAIANLGNAVGSVAGMLPI